MEDSDAYLQDGYQTYFAYIFVHFHVCVHKFAYVQPSMCKSQCACCMHIHLNALDCCQKLMLDHASSFLIKAGIIDLQDLIQIQTILVWIVPITDSLSFWLEGQAMHYSHATAWVSEFELQSFLLCSKHFDC